MRIDYKILWIEDSSEWLESVIEDVQKYLENFGFNLVHERIDKYEEKNFPQYDLIAIDLELENEESGVDAIERIRDGNNFYTEILFYSQSGEKNLRNELSGKSVDGVYCSSRESFLKNIQKLIYTTVRKTQELNNLRGLVMAEETELQNLAKNILLKIHLNPRIPDPIEKAGYDYTCNYLKSKLKEIEKIDVNADYEKFLKLPVYGGHGKKTTLLDFLKIKAASDGKYGSLLSIMDLYEDEIIHMRNDLAHLTEQEKDGKIILVKEGEECEFTEAEFTKIRKDIRKHKENLKALDTLIDNV
jgi:hypothetical protein